MPKDEPRLALKLREAMAEKGVTGAQLERDFGVTAPTVSNDWRKHGRIDKKHYPRLVGYFGKPYEWWFGDPEGEEAPDLYVLRRENFQQAIREVWNNSPAEAARALGLTAEQVQQYNTRLHSITPSLARKIERVAKLGSGWLDLVHDAPRPVAVRKRA